MPKKTKKPTSAGEPAPQLRLTLGDKQVAVPRYESLSLDECFAIRGSTGLKAEQLWFFAVDEPIGRATMSVWWWIARCREVGHLMPLEVVSAELDAASEAGDRLVVSFGVDPDETDTEDLDPEG